MCILEASCICGFKEVLEASCICEFKELLWVSHLWQEVYACMHACTLMNEVGRPYPAFQCCTRLKKWEWPGNEASQHNMVPMVITSICQFVWNSILNPVQL